MAWNNNKSIFAVENIERQVDNQRLLTVQSHKRRILIYQRLPLKLLFVSKNIR
jgi:hypothetical protein